MKKMIIDTSTLFDVAGMNVFENSRSNPVLDVFIEGVVLYENPIYDKGSIDVLLDKRIYDDEEFINEERREKLEALLKLCNPLDGVIEGDTSTGIVNLIMRKAEAYLENKELIKRHSKIYSKKEAVQLEKKFLNEGEKFLENPLAYYENRSEDLFFPSLNKSALVGVEPKESNEHLIKQVVVPQLLRIFYYQVLQEKYNSHYQPHPERGKFFLTPSPKGIGAKIISYFNEKVRNSIETDMNEIFGTRNLSFEIPLLTSYIMNGVSSFNDLIEKINEVKNSKEAIHFREGIDELERAILGKDKVKVVDAIQRLKREADEWPKSLRGGINNTKVTICGVVAEKDFKVPMSLFYKTNNDKILVFVHELIKKS